MAIGQLSDEHYNLFGRIMYGYASVEDGFKILLSGMLRIDILIFMVLSEPYSSLDLKKVMKSIAKLSEFEHEDEYQKIIDMVGKFQSFSRIRNHIAHNRWSEGERPNSIKPILMNIRKGKAVPMGYSDGEKDYTIEDLIDLADGIFGLNADLQNFIIEYGYEDIIEEIISDIGSTE